MAISNYVYRFSFSDLQDVASETHQNCFDKLKEAFTATVVSVISPMPIDHALMQVPESK